MRTRSRPRAWASPSISPSARPARLLDLVENRTAEAYGSWLAARTPQWREQVRLAALDPFRGYLNALRSHLPHATHVLDAFHVVKLGFQAVDEVRRRAARWTRSTPAPLIDTVGELQEALNRTGA